MINATNLIFSMASAARILAKELGDIFKKVEWIKFTGKTWTVVYRTKFGRCCTFISAKLFKLHFVERRQEEAKGFEVSKVRGNWFKVVNPKKGTSYNVQAYQEGVDCACEDFRNQSNYLPKACCKHCYAVLNHLGFNNLSDYIEHNQWTSESSQEFLEDPDEYIYDF